MKLQNLQVSNEYGSADWMASRVTYGMRQAEERGWGLLPLQCQARAQT